MDPGRGRAGGLSCPGEPSRRLAALRCPRRRAGLDRTGNAPACTRWTPLAWPVLPSTWTQFWERHWRRSRPHPKTERRARIDPALESIRRFGRWYRCRGQGPSMSSTAGITGLVASDITSAARAIDRSWSSPREGGRWYTATSTAVETSTFYVLHGSRPNGVVVTLQIARMSTTPARTTVEVRLFWGGSRSHPRRSSSTATRSLRAQPKEHHTFDAPALADARRPTPRRPGRRMKYVLSTSPPTT